MTFSLYFYKYYTAVTTKKFHSIIFWSVFISHFIFCCYCLCVSSCGEPGFNLSVFTLQPNGVRTAWPAAPSAASSFEKSSAILSDACDGWIGSEKGAIVQTDTWCDRIDTALCCLGHTSALSWHLRWSSILGDSFTVDSPADVILATDGASHISDSASTRSSRRWHVLAVICHCTTCYCRLIRFLL